MPIGAALTWDRRWRLLRLQLHPDEPGRVLPDKAAACRALVPAPHHHGDRCGTLLLYIPRMARSSERKNLLTWCGATGIRTPGLLHAMPANSVRPRRPGSSTGRSGPVAVSGCGCLWLAQSEGVVTRLVTGLSAPHAGGVPQSQSGAATGPRSRQADRTAVPPAPGPAGGYGKGCCREGDLLIEDGRGGQRVRDLVAGTRRNCQC
jgi:hypothetical protein